MRTAASRRRPAVLPGAGSRCATLAALVCAALASTATAGGSCVITRTPDIPVTMSGGKPMVHAQINGIDALFIADSGAFFSSVTPDAMRELKMEPDPKFREAFVMGVGGRESAEVARAKTFALMNTTLRNVPFIVTGRNVHGAAGLLGQNIFRVEDVEYDLANAIIRLVRPKDCKDQPLAYWAAAAGKPYSVIDIDFATARSPHTRADAYLNGKKIGVLFDTGANRSLLTLAAARRAGITSQSPGVEPADPTYGIGRKVSPSWVARFDSFKIGDEEIRSARLRFADVELVDADMLLGADFFLSHRLYVATSQRKLYFTYNGGPVFDLERTHAAEDAGSAADAPAAAGSAATAPTPAQEPAPLPADADSRLDTPKDAEGFARRGQAAAARHDYVRALADLDRACELAPNEANYFYVRALVHLSNHEAQPGAADLDKALALQPDLVPALLARAGVRYAAADQPGATGDLERAERALPAGADEHLRIAGMYDGMGNPAAARAQYTRWIENHRREDTRMPQALNGRCWAGALTGQELELALADCNAALRIGSIPNFLDSRGLVNLRLGRYDKAIEDYDAALRMNPRIAWSLYGRGLAKLRKGLAAGQADIEAAKALQPNLPEYAAKFGIAP